VLPLISVITPSLNQGRFLEQCIRSVLEQGYERLEYIVIDGGSTDETVSILERYAGRIAHWVSEPDKGQSDAFNKGLALAKGEWIGWLNSDDVYLPNALKTVAAQVDKFPNAPFLFGDGVHLDEAGRRLRNHFPRGTLRFDRDALRFGLDYILQPATFIRSAPLRQVGGLAADLHYGMDFDLWLRLSALGEPAVVDAILAGGRLHGNTKTANGSFKRAEELRRIAANHTGQPMTPGALCYFLDTVDRSLATQPEVSPRVRRRVLSLLGEVSLGFETFGANPEGFPLPEGHSTVLGRISRAGWVRLRNLVKGRMQR
jgi:glycosyltransferase involved in cell wall biosynthesis